MRATQTTTIKPRRLVLHCGGQDDVYCDPARFKVLAAGRRWGKTELALAQLLTACMDVNRVGVYRYIAPTQKLARKTLWRRKLKRVLHPTWLLKEPNETNLEVWFKTGSILEVLGADDPDGLRGEGVRGAVLDEYADMAEETWPEAVRPSLADMRGWALFIGTPKSFNHFHTLYERGHDPAHPTWRSWQFKSLDNPLLDADEVEEARRTTDPRTFRQEWEASFEALKGRAYYAFNRTYHVKPVELVNGLPVCISFDFNIHPATAVIGQQHGDEPWVWREAWIEHAGGEATRSAAQAAKDYLAKSGWSGEVRIYGDPAGKAGKTTGPSDHAVLKEVFPGARWCIPSGPPHVKDRVAAVNARCETMDGARHLRVDPSCTHLISDLNQVTFLANGDLDKRTNEMLTHVSDALGYWIHQEFPLVEPTVTFGRVRLEQFL
jgi:hypothetical protein